MSGTTATTPEGGFIGDIAGYCPYVPRHADWPEVGRALSEAFIGVRPTGTLIGVDWLVDPRMIVEIDVDAVVGSADDRVG